MRLALRCPLPVVLCQRLFVNPEAGSRTRLGCPQIVPQAPRPSLSLSLSVSWLFVLADIDH